MSTGAARDLSGKLQTKLAEVLDRELHIFAHVLEPTAIGEVMLEAAMMVARTTAATISGFADRPEEIAAIYRAVTAEIVRQLQTSEQDGIDRATAAVRARAA